MRAYVSALFLIDWMKVCGRGMADLPPSARFACPQTHIESLTWCAPIICDNVCLSAGHGSSLLHTRNASELRKVEHALYECLCVSVWVSLSAMGMETIHN